MVVPPQLIEALPNAETPRELGVASWVRALAVAVSLGKAVPLAVVMSGGTAVATDSGALIVPLAMLLVLVAIPWLLIAVQLIAGFMSSRVTLIVASAILGTLDGLMAFGAVAESGSGGIRIGDLSFGVGSVFAAVALQGVVFVGAIVTRR